jgi:hypothetical protein
MFLLYNDQSPNPPLLFGWMTLNQATLHSLKVFEFLLHKNLRIIVDMDPMIPLGTKNTDM